MPLLGTVRLDARLREQGDIGVPLVAADPDAEAARAIRAIAETIAGSERERGVGILKPLTVLS